MNPWVLAHRNERMRPSAIREIMKLAEQPGIISLAAGLPSAKAFPVEAIAEACSRVLSRDTSAALQYAASEGYAPLIGWVADKLAKSGMKVDARQILITNGSQQGLDLIAKVLIDKGARVLVESPTYVGALQAFAPMEPELLSVVGDNEGVSLTALQLVQAVAREKGEGARFFYVSPNFQNPSGRSMSERARVALCEEAARLGLPLVEDDPYGDIWYGERPPSSLFARNPEHCVYLGSFSKILAPGLRLGYLVAPHSLFPKLLQAKQASDLHTPTFNQRVALEVLKDGYVERHVPAIRAMYKAHRDAMLAALERECRRDKLLEWSPPSGGMFIWAKLPMGLNARALLSKAVARGVAYVPGEVFFANNADLRTLRLSFVTASVEQIRLGIAALAATIRESLMSVVETHT